MSVITLVILAIGLAMDAFAVSISSGMSRTCNTRHHSLRCGLSFGLFQGGMTLAGLLVASMFSKYIEPVDHWVAFILLLFVGGKMIYEATQDVESPPITSTKNLLILSVATSIDALAAGISLAAVRAPVILSIVLITVITFVLSYLGVHLGARIASRKAGKAFDVIGGLILIGLGIKILIEHLS